MRLNLINKFSSFYFIGIGGVSMSALAKYLLKFGKKVGGSDAVSSEFTDELIEKGVKNRFRRRKQYR